MPAYQLKFHPNLYMCNKFLWPFPSPGARSLFDFSSIIFGRDLCQSTPTFTIRSQHHCIRDANFKLGDHFVEQLAVSVDLIRPHDPNHHGDRHNQECNTLVPKLLHHGNILLQASARMGLLIEDVARNQA